MGSTHGLGVKKAQTNFMVSRRGFLTPYQQGMVSDTKGNIKGKTKAGIPDLFGNMFKTAEHNHAQSLWVEVKTRAYPKLSKGQKSFMEQRYKEGCKCVCFREQKDGTWKEFDITEPGFYHKTKKRGKK